MQPQFNPAALAEQLLCMWATWIGGLTFFFAPGPLPAQAELVGSRRGVVSDTHVLVYSLKVIPRSGSGKQLLGERLGWQV